MSDLTPDSRLSLVRQNIEQVEKDCNLSAGSTRLVAVSKTRMAADIAELVKQNQLDFGENYVQEAIEKINILADTPIIWHFIGPIQKNKTRLIAEHFSWVHSIDRKLIATRLNDQRSVHKSALNACIQVNIDLEETKSGVTPQEVAALAEHIDKLPYLNLRGLMAIPSKTEKEDQQRLVFEKMYSLFETLSKNYASMDTLSMGMSGDYPMAIRCGANMIRIGNALFGPRIK